MDDIKELYAQMLRLPDGDSRESSGLPRSRTAFAKKYDLNRSTLWRWEQDDDFKKDLVSPIMEIIRPDSIIAIIKAQEVRALDGNTTAAKFIMDITGTSGKFKAAVPVDDEEDDFFDGMSKEQIEAYLASHDD